MSIERLEALSGEGAWAGREQDLSRYLELLQKWGAVHNLSTVLDTEGIIKTHFLDCASAYRIWAKSERGQVFDFGSGAGLPAVVWAILDRRQKVTALERSKKKCSFLTTVKTELRLENLNIICGDAREVQAEHNDWVTSRATFSDLSFFEEVPAKLALLLGPSTDEQELRERFASRSVEWFTYRTQGERILALVR